MIHDGLTIRDADRLFDLLRDGVVFRKCTLDEADLRDFDAEESGLLEFGMALREAVVTTTAASDANDAIGQRRPVVTEGVDVAIGADVDVVVEATGNPDAGALHAFRSIRSGRARRHG